MSDRDLRKRKREDRLVACVYLMVAAFQGGMLVGSTVDALKHVGMAWGLLCFFAVMGILRWPRD